MNKKTFLKCYVCALFFATAAYAESGHSMKGTVADANGKPLSGVFFSEWHFLKKSKRFFKGLGIDKCGNIF